MTEDDSYCSSFLAFDVDVVAARYAEACDVSVSTIVVEEDQASHSQKGGSR